MTCHPSFASFKCFLGAGDYDFYLAKSGYTFETLTGVQGHGTMAQQDASAVAITGGSANGLTTMSSNFVTAGQVLCDWRVNPVHALRVNNAPAGSAVALYGDIATGANRFNVYCPGTALNHMAGALGIGAVPPDTARLHLDVDKNLRHGILLKHSTLDVGGTHPIIFQNVAGTQIGSISTTAAATAFNTTSDARLKHAVTTLLGELAVIRALRPVRFRWLADDSEGVGFLAGEVAEHVPGVVTGEADAVDEEGGIIPQQIDYSKLVPWLVGALQTLAGQVETLTERVQALEDGLGV
jgi:hypothetical protein